MSESMKESLRAVENAAILIPSLEPDERLPAYIRKLSENGFGKIIVVDDGSSELYQPIFREVESIDRAVVLHHGVNRGKGVALKTGYKYILDNLPGTEGVITADADGRTAEGTESAVSRQPRFHAAGHPAEKPQRQQDHFSRFQITVRTVPAGHTNRAACIPEGRTTVHDRRGGRTV